MEKSIHFRNDPPATIFALSSGAGRAAVAVVRLSGPAVAGVVATLAGRLPPARQAVLCKLREPETGEEIDRGLVLWMPGPASFTGEDMAELHVHGGPAVVARLFAVLSRWPTLRPAEAGEFTRRAFDNGKLDLVEVEGLADLLMADTDAQLRQALQQMDGRASRRFEAWRNGVIGVLSRIEAVIDFADEDGVEAAARADIGPRIEALRADLASRLGEAHRGERLREGVRVVIAGPPNAGKSSLLNVLARRDAAIVSPEVGTTRDLIDIHLDLGGVPVVVTDTAGLRSDQVGVVERIGIERARDRLAGADLVLWVNAPDVALEVPEFDSEPLWIWNKADLAASPAGLAGRAIAVSTVTGEGLDRLLDELSRAVAHRYGGSEPALVVRERQRLAVEAALAALERAQAVPAGAPELVAEELRAAAHTLERLIGRVDVDDLLDAIFRDFCIGK